MKKIFYLLPLFVLTSCITKPKIDKYDLVKKCTVDSVVQKPQISIMDYEPSYYVYTSCGDKYTTKRPDIHKIGDTITCVYKGYYLKNKH
jgi:hypothetical protein